MKTDTDPHHVAHIPVQALGWSLGLFFAIAFAICVLFDLAFQSQAMTGLWQPILPWVQGISLGGVLLGLVEAFLYGWFVALIFAPLFNFFAERTA